jgi:carbon-monoxide dehydrogenase small subunit
MVDLTVNRKRRRVRVPALKRLLDVLRDECELTGTKEGCGEGECGACTVLLNGRAVNSCLVPAIHAAGARVVTVEGLGSERRLSALQRAFVELGGAQCGICTPGMLISAYELIARSKRRVPSEDEVREALAGNLCRCTGYQKIVDAVRAAAGGGRTARGRPASRRARSLGGSPRSRPALFAAAPRKASPGGSPPSARSARRPRASRGGRS